MIGRPNVERFQGPEVFLDTVIGIGRCWLFVAEDLRLDKLLIGEDLTDEDKNVILQPSVCEVEWQVANDFKHFLEGIGILCMSQGCSVCGSDHI